MVINGSVILITSAGTILGRNLTQYFASLGAKIVVTDCDKQQLQQTYAECLEAGRDVYPYFIKDYSQHSVDQLFNFIETQFEQSIDILINNWLNRPLPTLTSSASGEEFGSQFSHLAQSMYSFGHSCANQMCKHHKHGVIVNLLTNECLDKILGTESASSMVDGMTKSWAKELQPFDIRVGGILPTIHHDAHDDYLSNFAKLSDELVRNAEYIIENDSFHGRVMSC
ncbi:SDR family oxidoreductase [Vibrio gallicus]|uniref:SDR family oxidoreductase n=1 Tax=Vibrio gallicus TaxID=190897 RepID=UPI0021C3E93A|nr:SDR family oxidoreductase [Vibrio gallicus]